MIEEQAALRRVATLVARDTDRLAVFAELVAQALADAEAREELATHRPAPHP